MHNKNTLNIKLNSETYNQLDRESEARGQSKTYLVETALQFFFAKDLETPRKATLLAGKPTELVKHFLDSHAYNNFDQDISKFKSEVIKELTDVNIVEAEELLLIILKDVDWDYLWRSEYQRMIEDQKEAEKNREEQENLGDIPF